MLPTGKDDNFELSILELLSFLTMDGMDIGNVGYIVIL